MRYYDLKISDPNTGRIWSTLADGSFVLGSAATTFTSYANGKFIPGALNLEIDCPVVPFHEPQGKASIRVWGVSLRTLSQSANLNDQNIELRAGMSAGLPLAKPGQGGLIVRGRVFQAFGNWQGTDQTLDMVIYPHAARDEIDGMFRWPAGTTLASALAAAFSQAFPGYGQDIKISSQLTTMSAEMGHFKSLSVFADYISRISTALGTPIYGDRYAGVSIVVDGKTIRAFDGTVAPKTFQLAFEDLIGQPTWLSGVEIGFATVMRADLQIGSIIRFPTGVVSPYALTPAAAAYPNVPARSRTVFQNEFLVNEVHHFGNFRQASADSWVTAFKAIAKPTLSIAPRAAVGGSLGG